MLNRFNVCLIGFYASSQNIYLPSWREVTISLFLVTVGIVIFALSIHYLDIYPPDSAPQDCEEDLELKASM